MGTWGNGLFDGDGPLDVIGDIGGWIEGQVQELSEAEPTVESAGRLAGAVGLLLQLSPYSFEGEFSETIRSAIVRHRKAMEGFSEQALSLLDTIAEGSGKKLADSLGDRSEALKQILGEYVNHPRHEPLFESDAARALVQETAEYCVEQLEEMLEDEDLDLYELADPVGAVGVLLLLSPCRIKVKSIDKWRRQVKAVIERERKQDPDNPDLEFYDEYLPKAEAAFRLLEERSHRK